MMDDNQRELYQDLFNLLPRSKGREKVINIFDSYKDDFFSAKAALNPAFHQSYPGGLADHTALVTLVGYYTAFTNPVASVFLDDIVITCLFHDFSKVDRQKLTDEKVISILARNGIMNEQIRHGIILAHGGWSKIRVMSHKPIAIITHYADMIGAHAFKKKDETLLAIDEYRKYIKLMEVNDNMITNNTKREKPVCKECGRTLIQVADPSRKAMSNFWDCLYCRLRYRIGD